MENKETQNSLFKETIQENDKSGELKVQVTIDLSEYDTSTMDGYKAGSKVYRGYTCKIATLKPNKAHPRSRVDIDPSNKEVRKAILDMYATYDKLISLRK
jgi:hypothetical protein